VSSAYLEADDAVCLIDPLVPRGDEERFFAALDADVERLGRPVAIVLTNPWHRRSTDELATRYAGSVHVGAEGGLPGGLVAYPGGMQADDIVLHAPSHRALFHHLVEGTALDAAGAGLLAELDAHAASEGIGEATANELLLRLREREMQRELRSAPLERRQELSEALAKVRERAASISA